MKLKRLSSIHQRPFVGYFEKVASESRDETLLIKKRRLNCGLVRVDWGFVDADEIGLTRGVVEEGFPVFLQLLPHPIRTQIIHDTHVHDSALLHFEQHRIVDNVVGSKELGVVGERLHQQMLGVGV